MRGPQRPPTYTLPPLFVAAGETPHPAVISLLVAPGAEVDARMSDGPTPLDPAARDARGGKTPMDYARENEAQQPWERVKMSTQVDKK